MLLRNRSLKGSRARLQLGHLPWRANFQSALLEQVEFRLIESRLVPANRKTQLLKKP